MKLLKFVKNRWIEISLFVFSLILFLISSDFPFYWDNIVQTSVPANWYFNTNFKSFFIPDMIATGHPTFVALYFSIIWKLFGYSLLISHIAMLPFVFGLTIEINELIKIFKIEKKIRILVLLFVFADTTILSQMSLITFEIFHLFFFFLCINSILKNKKIMLTIAFLFLVLVSLRGTICGGGILIFHILYDYYKTKNFNIKRYASYLVGILAISVFLLSFYIEKGWIVHNTVSNAWKESAEFASPLEILRNIGIFIWRLIDFGRVFIFIIFGFFLIKLIKKKRFENENLRTLFLIILSQFLVFFPLIIIYKNSFGHRYLIPIIIPVIILVILWTSLLKKGKNIIFVLAFTSLISGHFWIYPEKIAQGWDATTLHWNYYDVRKKMLSYLKENKLDIKNIGTFFPNTRSLKDIDLNLEDISFKYANLENDTLIIYSNTFNEEDKYIDALFDKNKWEVIKSFESNKIYMTLFKKL